MRATTKNNTTLISTLFSLKLSKPGMLMYDSFIYNFDLEL